MREKWDSTLMRFHIIKGKIENESQCQNHEKKAINYIKDMSIIILDKSGVPSIYMGHSMSYMIPRLQITLQITL